MKQDTYCLTSPILEEDPLWGALYSIKMMLRNHDIPHSLPRLHWHITHVTPFLATAAEVKWLALGLEIGKALSPSEHREHLVRGVAFDFYENEMEDALILRLETSEEFRNIISRARVQVEGMTDMRYPPESFQVNFHVTIAQGKGLRKSIESCPEVNNKLSKIETRLVTRLQYPSISMKGTSYWIPVVI